MNIKVTKTTTPKQKPADESKLGFCKTFSDHMFLCEYTPQTGWTNPRIEPYHPLAIDPASPVLHYAQEIFEGMKAYRYDNGEIGLFRPTMNCERLNRSADRLCIPQIPVELQLAAIRAIVDIDRDWTPTLEGTSLYIRPTVIANGCTLGLSTANEYIFYIICSPASAYFSQGLKPVQIYIEDKYVRAVRGGVGAAKTGGNYAASLKASEEAKAKGYNQVLWLDGRENRYVQEVGAMNIAFVIDGKIVTPSLEDSILAGVTRDSVIQIGKDLGFEVIEKRIDVEELVAAYEAGKLQEAFGTGTAAVISPISRLEYKGKVMQLGDDQTAGPIAHKLYDTLYGIQRGRIADIHGWTETVAKNNY